MIEDVLWTIQKLGVAATDPHMDGYNQFGKKKELYKILWAVEKQLSRCSNFYGEDEWLREHAQDVFMEKLEGKL
jgi:hypothetical protein